MTGASIELLGCGGPQRLITTFVVSFPSYDYVVTLDGSQIYVVKCATTSEYSQ